jgi:hypothetical protein
VQIAGKATVQEASIAAVVIRADGTREELGVISYWHRRWWRRALWKLTSTRRKGSDQWQPS